MFHSFKPEILFYEKTGCMGNAKQKKLLGDYGIGFKTLSLLDTRWSFESLSDFFDGLTKDEIINPFAPSEELEKIDLKTMSKDELITHMVKNPILIKRPLISIGEVKICGFDIPKINSALNLHICEKLTINSCPNEDKKCVSD
ncbi:MAG: arsenate reductase family protein [Sulfurovaceae bacterium]|nr:arsenate reductase family protein [Sulfurovaceae bacterium]MDD5548652.1 arsenate reductase family protein [Sulfurovaceae bacterium]